MLKQKEFVVLFVSELTVHLIYVVANLKNLADMNISNIIGLAWVRNFKGLEFSSGISHIKYSELRWWEFGTFFFNVFLVGILDISFVSKLGQYKDIKVCFVLK